MPLVPHARAGHHALDVIPASGARVPVLLAGQGLHPAGRPAAATMRASRGEPGPGEGGRLPFVAQHLARGHRVRVECSDGYSLRAKVGIRVPLERADLVNK